MRRLIAFFTFLSSTILVFLAFKLSAKAIQLCLIEKADKMFLLSTAIFCLTSTILLAFTCFNKWPFIYKLAMLLTVAASIFLTWGTAMEAMPVLSGNKGEQQYVNRHHFDKWSSISRCMRNKLICSKDVGDEGGVLRHCCTRPDGCEGRSWTNPDCNVWVDKPDVKCYLCNACKRAAGKLIQRRLKEHAKWVLGMYLVAMFSLFFHAYVAWKGKLLLPSADPAATLAEELRNAVNGGEDGADGGGP